MGVIPPGLSGLLLIGAFHDDERARERWQPDRRGGGWLNRLSFTANRLIMVSNGGTDTQCGLALSAQERLRTDYHLSVHPGMRRANV